MSDSNEILHTFSIPISSTQSIDIDAPLYFQEILTYRHKPTQQYSDVIIDSTVVQKLIEVLQNTILFFTITFNHQSNRNGHNLQSQPQEKPDGSRWKINQLLLPVPENDNQVIQYQVAATYSGIGCFAALSCKYFLYYVHDHYLNFPTVATKSGSWNENNSIVSNTIINNTNRDQNDDARYARAQVIPGHLCAPTWVSIALFNRWNEYIESYEWMRQVYLHCQKESLGSWSSSYRTHDILNLKTKSLQQTSNGLFSFYPLDHFIPALFAANVEPTEMPMVMDWLALHPEYIIKCIYSGWNTVVDVIVTHHPQYIADEFDRKDQVDQHPIVIAAYCGNVTMVESLWYKCFQPSSISSRSSSSQHHYHHHHHPHRQQQERRVTSDIPLYTSIWHKAICHAMQFNYMNVFRVLVDIGKANQITYQHEFTHPVDLTLLPALSFTTSDILQSLWSDLQWRPNPLSRQHVQRLCKENSLAWLQWFYEYKCLPEGAEMDIFHFASKPVLDWFVQVVSPYRMWPKYHSDKELLAYMYQAWLRQGDDDDLNPTNTHSRDDRDGARDAQDSRAMDLAITILFEKDLLSSSSISSSAYAQRHTSHFQQWAIQVSRCLLRQHLPVLYNKWRSKVHELHVQKSQRHRHLQPQPQPYHTVSHGGLDVHHPQSDDDAEDQLVTGLAWLPPLDTIGLTMTHKNYSKYWVELLPSHFAKDYLGLFTTNTDEEMDWIDKRFNPGNVHLFELFQTTIDYMWNIEKQQLQSARMLPLQFWLQRPQPEALSFDHMNKSVNNANNVVDYWGRDAFVNELSKYCTTWHTTPLMRGKPCPCTIWFRRVQQLTKSTMTYQDNVSFAGHKLSIQGLQTCDWIVPLEAIKDFALVRIIQSSEFLTPQVEMAQRKMYASGSTELLDWFQTIERFCTDDQKTDIASKLLFHKSYRPIQDILIPYVKHKWSLQPVVDNDENINNIDNIDNTINSQNNNTTTEQYKQLVSKLTFISHQNEWAWNHKLLALLQTICPGPAFDTIFGLLINERMIHMHRHHFGHMWRNTIFTYHLVHPQSGSILLDSFSNFNLQPSSSENMISIHFQVDDVDNGDDDYNGNDQDNKINPMNQAYVFVNGYYISMDSNPVTSAAQHVHATNNILPDQLAMCLFQACHLDEKQFADIDKMLIWKIYRDLCTYPSLKRHLMSKRQLVQFKKNQQKRFAWSTISVDALGKDNVYNHGQVVKQINTWCHQ